MDRQGSTSVPLKDPPQPRIFSGKGTRSVPRQLVALAFESAFWPLIPDWGPHDGNFSRRRPGRSSTWLRGYAVHLDESFEPGELDGFLGSSFGELHRSVLLVLSDRLLADWGSSWCFLTRCLSKAEVLLEGGRCALRGPEVLTCVPDLAGVTDPADYDVHVVLSVADHHPRVFLVAHALGHDRRRITPLLIAEPAILGCGP